MLRQHRKNITKVTVIKMFHRFMSSSDHFLQHFREVKQKPKCCDK